jgi:hypothetical protein
MDMDERRGPGGFLGLILLLALLGIGYLTGIGWMVTVGGVGTVIWLAMLVFGFLLGAKG